MGSLAALKTVIVFFYMLNGETVSVTASEYSAFQDDAGILSEWTCEMLIQDPGFASDVRSGFTDGETMRAECHLADDVTALSEPYSTILIEPE